MQVAPLVDSVGHSVAHGGGGDDHGQQQGMEAGEQHQVDQKAQHIGQQIGPGGPDMLRSGAVAVGDTLGLLQHLEKAGVQQIGVGGPGRLAVEPIDEGGTYIDAPIHRILVQVPGQTGKEEQRQCEEGDGPEDLGERRGSLYRAQNARGDQQLRHGLPGPGHSQGDAHGHHAFAPAPGGLHHKGRVLPEIVRRFLCLFHVLTSGHSIA